MKCVSVSFWRVSTQFCVFPSSQVSLLTSLTNHAERREAPNAHSASHFPDQQINCLSYYAIASWPLRFGIETNKWSWEHSQKLYPKIIASDCFFSFWKCSTALWWEPDGVPRGDENPSAISDQFYDFVSKTFHLHQGSIFALAVVLCFQLSTSNWAFCSGSDSDKNGGILYGTQHVVVGVIKKDKKSWGCRFTGAEESGNCHWCFRFKWTCKPVRPSPYILVSGWWKRVGVSPDHCWFKKKNQGFWQSSTLSRSLLWIAGQDFTG